MVEINSLAADFLSLFAELAQRCTNGDHPSRRGEANLAKIKMNLIDVRQVGQFRAELMERVPRIRYVYDNFFAHTFASLPPFRTTIFF
jgi:hypothetical protein